MTLWVTVSFIGELCGLGSGRVFTTTDLPARGSSTAVSALLRFQPSLSSLFPLQDKLSGNNFLQSVLSTMLILHRRVIASSGVTRLPVGSRWTHLKV